MRNIAITLAVLAAGLSVATVASAESPACWTTAETTGQLWTYTHTATWCGDGKAVTSVETPRVEGRAQDGTCTWQGVKETRRTRVGDRWETFSMGTFTCRTAKGTQEGFNPWVVVTVSPDGGHAADSGTTRFSV